MKTNCKEVINKIKNHIGEFYTPQELKNEVDGIKCYQYPTDYHCIKHMAEGGSFLIYYNEVVEFLNNLGINPEGKEYPQEKSWELYCHLIARDGSKYIKNI